MKNILIGILIAGILFVSFLYLDAKKMPSPQSYFVQSTHVFYKRLDRQYSHRTVLFIGDSLIQGLAVSEISKDAINFGIGTDTVGNVRARLSGYNSTSNTDCIFIGVGINDLMRGQSLASTLNEFSLLLASLSDHPRVVVGELLPVNSLSDKLKRIAGDISTFNLILAEEIDKYDNVSLVKQYDIFLNGGNELSNMYHVGDGLHLNTSGNRLWIEHLKRQLPQHHCEIET